MEYETIAADSREYTFTEEVWLKANERPHSKHSSVGGANTTSI